MDYMGDGLMKKGEKESGSICNFNKRYLYPLRKDHLSKIQDWRNSQIDILRQWKPLTEYNQEKWFLSISEDNNKIFFAIMVPNQQNNIELEGYCGITNVDFINRRGEISFLMNPLRVQNKELYSDDFLSVLYLLCQYGFKNLNLHKIFTETFAFREYHIKILKEFGFNEECTLKEHNFIKGTYYDSYIHSIMHYEWNDIKRGIKDVFEK